MNIYFKNSPLFTQRRKDRIASRMESFYTYLEELGLTAPKDIPPIAVGNSYSNALIYPGPLYLGTVTMPEKDIDDPETPVYVYAMYCFPVMMDVLGNYLDDRRLRAAWIFQTYFVSSFSAGTVC